MEGNPKTLSRAQVLQITKDRLNAWRKRNAKEEVMCTPIILISAVAGDKPGLVLNLVPQMPKEDVLAFLKASADQVEKHMAEAN